MTTTAIAQRIHTIVGRRDATADELSSSRAKVTTLQHEWDRDESARIVGQYLTERARDDVQSVFGGVGTAALQALFGPEIKFSVEFDETPKSGKRRAHLVVEERGVKGDPLARSGNSVAGVLSTILRRAMIVLHPKLRNVLIADEPLSALDTGRQPEMAEIDRQMCDDQGLQYIVITHEGEGNYEGLADVVHRMRMGPEGTIIKTEDRRESDEL